MLKDKKVVLFSHNRKTRRLLKDWLEKAGATVVNATHNDRPVLVVWDVDGSPRKKSGEIPLLLVTRRKKPKHPRKHKVYAIRKIEKAEFLEAIRQLLDN